MATRHISIPDELLASIRVAADTESRSVDDVIADALQRYLDDRSWSRLLDYGAERAKTLGIREPDIDRLIAEARAEHSN